MNNFFGFNNVAYNPTDVSPGSDRTTRGIYLTEERFTLNMCDLDGECV